VKLAFVEDFKLASMPKAGIMPCCRSHGHPEGAKGHHDETT